MDITETERYGTFWCRPTGTAIFISRPHEWRVSSRHAVCPELNWAKGVTHRAAILTGGFRHPRHLYLSGINGLRIGFAFLQSDTGLFYVVALESCDLFLRRPGNSYQERRSTTPAPRFHQRKGLRRSCWHFPPRMESCLELPSSGSANPGRTLTTAGIAVLGTIANPWKRSTRVQAGVVAL